MSQWGHVLVTVASSSPKVLLGYAEMGSVSFAEVAVDIAVVGLGRPLAKEFDGAVRNSLSGDGSGGASTEGVAAVKFGGGGSLTLIKPGSNGN